MIEFGVGDLVRHKELGTKATVRDVGKSTGHLFVKFENQPGVTEWDAFFWELVYDEKP